MKNFVLIVIASFVLSAGVFGQTKKTITDIKKQIESSAQKKNMTVSFDEKSNRSAITTTRFVLGRQDMVQDTGGDTNSFRTSVPSWELVVNSAFESGDLTTTLDEFAWRFNVYNPRFPMDTDLKVKVDNQELTFKSAKSGRVTVNLALSDGVFQQDKSTNTIQQNTGNMSDSSKPVYSIFLLTRSDIDKMLLGAKVKIMLNKQYEVNLPKDVKSAVELMLSLTTVP